MELPHELRLALEDELQGLPAKKLATVAAELSQRYRAEGPASGVSLVRSREDVAAYAAFRLPATFGAITAALEQVRDRLPEWQPRSLADVGAGPGTASWAATDVWPEIERIILFEREDGMIALGQHLAQTSSLPALAEAIWRKVELTGAWQAEPQDLVVAGYLLGELPDAQLPGLVEKLWGMTGGVLALIEPGTPAGFARIRRARAQLLAAGGFLIAPCPHGNACPMGEGNWCHFSQRVARSRLHRQIKGGDLSYEDEKFAYVAVGRMPGEPLRGRIIRHPQIQKGHVDLEVCGSEGLSKISITRRNRQMFRLARDLRWGDVMPAEQSADADEDAPGDGKSAIINRDE